MTPLAFLEEGLTPRLLGERIFAGDILVFRQVPSLRELLDVTDAIVRETFGDDPAMAHVRYDYPRLAEKASQAQRLFKAAPAVRALFQATLESLGVPPEESYWDRLRLRVVPSGPPSERQSIRSLPPHRDTWGSNLMAQVNWWAPLYSLTPARGLAIYPDYWDRPLANDSAGWDFEELLKAREEGRGYPRLPRASEEIDRTNELHLAPEPADMLCFSAAHLHGTVPNETGATRFSLETRTLWQPDLQAGRGAPNLDGRAPYIGYRWFTHMRQGHVLSAEGAWRKAS